MGHSFDKIYSKQFYGNLQVVGDNASILVSFEQNQPWVHIYQLEDEDIKYKEILIEFNPEFDSVYVDQAYTIRKHTILKQNPQEIKLYLVEANSRQRVAEVVVPLPISNRPDVVSYFDHDSQIHEMVSHPTENDVVVLDEGSFHLIKNDYEINFSQDDTKTSVISALRVIKVDETVFYYAFLLKEDNGQNYLEIVKMEEKNYLSQYIQHTNQMINLYDDLPISLLKRLQYNDEKQLFGLIIQFTDHFWFYHYTTYFIDVNLQVFAGEQQMFGDYEFHMFSKRKGVIGLIKYDSTCFAEYQTTNQNLAIKSHTKKCYFEDFDQRLYRVSEIQLHDEILPIIQPTQTTAMIYDDNFTEYMYYFDEVNQFSVKKPDHIILTKSSQELEVYKISDMDGGAIAGIVIGAILLMILIIVGICCWKKRGERNASDFEHEQENKKGKNFEYSEEDFCVVCLQTSCTCYLPCFHAFHEKCLEGWLKKDSKCPTCRTYATIGMMKKINI